jgi:methylmalonyl-CoA/ethylmalonyl-CoA epimerase
VITGLSHVAIAVPSITAAAEVLARRLGLAIGPIHDNAEQGVRLAYADLGNARLELIEPLRPDSPVARFLERNPAGGLHHLAFATGDLDAALAATAETGTRVVGRRGHNTHGQAIAFLHPADLLGALVELEERQDRPPA